MPGIMLALLSVVSVLELYPAPQSAYMHEKKQFELKSILPIVMEETAISGDTVPYLAPIYNALGYEPTLMSAAIFDLGREAIYIGIASEHSFWENRKLRKYAPDPEDSRPESYYLTINDDGIFLAAKDKAGLLHGVYTLAQIISSSLDAGLNRDGIPAVPYVEIRDYPELELRAAFLHGPVNSIQIQAFAALKCNMLIFESDDFYDLQGERLTLWQSIFKEAKTAGITPVPMFQLLHVPESLISKNPLAVEGRSRVDKIQLVGDDWSALTRRNLILTPENPILVTVNDKAMQLRRDYMISEGGIEAPFNETNAAPWLIRRVPGGNIPDGSVITVTYSYAPPHSTALCPHATETRLLARDALDRLIQGLQPAYIHGGGAEIARLNQDLRCRSTNKSHSEAFLATIKFLHNTLADLSSHTSLMIWADALIPPVAGTWKKDGSSLHTILSDIPSDILLITQFLPEECYAEGRAEEAIAWFEQHRRPVCCAVSTATPAAGYKLAHLANAQQQTPRGIVLENANPLDAPTRAIFGEAWATASQHLPWPEGLNDFFECALWNPEFSEVKKTLTQYLDTKILAGEAPKTLQDRFQDFLKSRRDQLSTDNDMVRMVSELFERFTRYLELEYEYARGEERDALKGMEKLLRDYHEYDQEMDTERLERIVNTVEQQHLFPPAPILIGCPLAYYRPGKLPTGINLYETPAQLTYNDERGVTEATFDFLADCGGVYRIDFETVNAQNIQLFSSADGVNYKPIPIYSNLDEDKTRRFGGLGGSLTTAAGENPVRGPIFPAVPLHTRFIRLRVESQADQAVLREVRAYSWKTVPRVTVSTFTNTKSDNVQWPDIIGITGFLHENGACLATAPTAINLARNNTHLFIGIMAEDPMPHAVGASMTLRDAPLWEEECVEVHIRPKDQSARCFIVNPLGTQYDAMAVAENLAAWDEGWDAQWRVQAEKTATGWTATLMLPFSILGGKPEKREEWQINVIRHRNNVEKEISAWIVIEGSSLNHYGTLVFD